MVRVQDSIFVLVECWDTKGRKPTTPTEGEDDEQTLPGADQQHN